MVTQLRQSGVLARAAAVVVGELPGCDEPVRRSDGALGRRRSVRRLSRTGADRISVRPYRRSRDDVAAWACDVPRWWRTAVRRLVSKRPPLSKRVHIIGICGTATATLAAMLKHKGFHVRGSDQDVYPPMSEFLSSEGIEALSGYRPEHITGDLDFVIVGNAISRGNVELEEVLDRKIRYCSLPEAIREHFLWGSRSIVIAGTHGKTTTTALAGWVLTDAGVDPSVLVGGIARNFGEHGSSYRMGTGPRLRDRRRRVRQRVLRQDRQVPQVPAGHCCHQQRRVRSRGHLCRRRVGDAGVPPAGQSRTSPRPAAARRRQRAGARARRRRQIAGRDVRHSRRRSTGRRTISSRSALRRGSRFDEGARRTAVFEVPLVGAHNVRNATAAIAIAADVGIGADADCRRRCAGSPA